MNYQAITNAPTITQMHIIIALASMSLGLFQLSSLKGTQLHKRLGWVWVGLMSLVGLTALLLPQREQGVVPLTILLTLWIAIGLPLAIISIKRGNILLHRAFMIGLYIGGLAVALAFTFTPGRLLYKVFFER